MITVNDLVEVSNMDFNSLKKITSEIDHQLIKIKKKYDYLKLDDTFWNNLIVTNSCLLLKNQNLPINVPNTDIKKFFLSNLNSTCIELIKEKIGEENLINKFINNNLTKKIERS